MTEMWLRAVERDAEGNEIKNWSVGLDWLANKLAKKLGSKDALKQGLGVCDLKDLSETAFDQIAELENIVLQMLMPKATHALINKFNESTTLDTRQLNTFIHSQTPELFSKACLKARDQLVEEHILTSIKQPRGHPRLWHLTKDPLALLPALEVT